VELDEALVHSFDGFIVLPEFGQCPRFVLVQVHHAIARPEKSGVFSQCQIKILDCLIEIPAGDGDFSEIVILRSVIMRRRVLRHDRLQEAYQQNEDADNTDQFSLYHNVHVFVSAQINLTSGNTSEIYPDGRYARYVCR